MDWLDTVREVWIELKQAFASPLHVLHLKKPLRAALDVGVHSRKPLETAEHFAVHTLVFYFFNYCRFEFLIANQLNNNNRRGLQPHYKNLLVQVDFYLLDIVVAHRLIDNHLHSVHYIRLFCSDVAEEQHALPGAAKESFSIHIDRDTVDGCVAKRCWADGLAFRQIENNYGMVVLSYTVDPVALLVQRYSFEFIVCLQVMSLEKKKQLFIIFRSVAVNSFVRRRSI